jgi:hypothetical protein
MSDQAHEPPFTDDLSHDIAAGLIALLHESRQLASMLLRKEQQHSPAIRKRLLQLCDRVAALERSVEITQKRLEEEAAVIHEMELLEKRAIERRHALILMLDQAHRGESTSLSSSILQQQSSNSTRFPSSATQLPLSNDPPRKNSDIRQSFERRQQFLTTRPKTPPVVVDTTSLESWPIQFERITKDELELSIPRTMRSGISVAMLNDALSDLEQLLEQTGDSWVTEQEIRQYCSFFRYGEATARAMLLLLCNLHRVTQRPEKGGDFIYEVPVLRDRVSQAD